MNAKNLPLKFAFLSLLVAVCIYSLCTKGLKPGIDLSGGHSLTFEIRTNAAEVNRLKIRQAELNAKIAQTTNEEEKKVLEETAKRLEGDLVQAVRDAKTDASLAEDMIKILKDRADPLGLLTLEWRPVGSNRFEVRMPAGDLKTQKAKDTYRLAIQALDSSNIEKSHIRNLEKQSTTAEELANSIKKLARGDEKLAELLDKLMSTFEKKQKADDTNRQRLISDWEDAEAKVLSYNVETQVLRSILSGYVRKADLAKLRGKPKALASLKVRKQGYETSIASFIEKHKDNSKRTADINKVVKSYTKWVDMRQELEDPSDLKRLITKAGALEFRIAPLSPEARPKEGQEPMAASERDKYVKILRNTLDKEGPQGLPRRTDRYLWFPIRGERKSGYASMVTSKYGGQTYLLLCNFRGKTLLQRRDADRWALTNASRSYDNKGLPAVDFSMDEAGAQFLHTLTRDNTGEHMAILLDSEVCSAPVIQTTISSRGQITMGTYNSEEVDSLVKILRAGSLPAKLIETPVAESSFGPTFGEANRDMGIRAGIIGMIAVAGFMCVYYMSAGVVAIIALMLNIVLVLGAMSLLGAVFTIPGIAGIILTIGIAVDSNVLIFERLREEQQRGTTVRRAMANAYQRAFSAIFDANITTLITCLILGWVGTEEVRGFAVTLSFGVMFSMFTALVVTRWIFQLLLDRNIISKPLNMLHVIGVPKINWMAKRHFFWVLSLAMVVIGIASMVGQGKDLLGIEFSAGTQAVITFKDDALIDGKLPNAELVRTRLMENVRKLADENYDEYGKLAETARIETRYDYKKVDRFIKRRDNDNDRKITLAEFNALPQANEAFFKLLDTDDNKDVLTEDELQNLPETSYQITTTEQSLPKISGIATDEFGTSLKRRISYLPKSAANANGYTEVANAMIPELELEANSDGYAIVRPRGTTAHTGTLEDFSEGVVIVLRGLTPKMTVRELQERIENMQMQTGFAEKTQNRVKAVALGGTGEGLFADFAVFARASQAAGQPAQAPDAVHEDLSILLTDSLERDEAVVAINFDPAIASGAAQSAGFAIIMSWIAIILYVWVRFGSIRWGLAAVVCLIHDVVIVVGLLAASLWIADTTLGGILGVGSFKIDLAMVAAILTVIGYSVNDTIVVFDRIRENRGKLASVSVMALNSSINQTLGRTLLTSTTTLIVVVIMYVAGGDAIRPFSFALLAGVLFGTYSSIAIASPLLMGLRKALVARTAGVAPAETES
ncbi:MAG: protein translocase subunit SecD [Phycisphaerae bacterium]|jgi:SecD/SecF fusion protein|nr:protein translocase subunit SecD [Phycisphaerae bacterium]